MNQKPYKYNRIHALRSMIGKRMGVFVIGSIVSTIILPFSGVIPVFVFVCITWFLEYKTGGFDLVERPMMESFSYLLFTLLVMSVFELSLFTKIYAVIFGVFVFGTFIAYTGKVFLALTFSDVPEDVEKYDYIVVLDFMRPLSFYVVTFECFLKNGECIMNGSYKVGVEELVTLRTAGFRAFKMYVHL